MKRKRFTEEQIIGVLKQKEAGSAVDDVCRRHGISQATFDAWRKKFGCVEVSDTERLRGNSRRKTPLTTLMELDQTDQSVQTKNHFC